MNRSIDENQLEHLLGLDSSKIGFYADVKQKIRELEAINRDLRVRTNELQAVFGAIKDGIAVFDAAGRLQYSNHVWAEIFPDSVAEPATCRRFFHPARDCGAPGCPVAGALRGEVRDDSLTIEGPKGTRYFETTATPIADADGRFARALVFLRDVTEKRVRELQLLQAEKLTSLGVLAAGVAHEINNPLNSVAGYAEALQRRLRDQPELATDPRLEDFPEYLEVIVREVYRCKGIIDSLLSFSRKSEHGSGPVDLRQMMDEAVQLLGHMARYHDVELHVEAAPEVPCVQGDPAALRQVILNLATNALQAVGRGGKVELRAFPQEHSVVFEVEDNGPGISEDLLERIWDPFFTTKGVGEGLGLGLSVSYNIVRRHRGEISVHSEVGEGTRFTVVLPATGGSQ